MSYQACIDEIRKVLGEDARDADVEAAFEDFMAALRRRRRENPNEPDIEAYPRAAEEFGEDLVNRRQIEKRNAEINAALRLRHTEYVWNNFRENPALGLESRLVGVNARVAGAETKHSAALQQRALAQSYLEGLYTDLLRADVWEDFAKGHWERDIYRALYALDDAEKLADLPQQAVTIAKIVDKYQELARLDANRAGAWIRKLPGYITRQSHDMYRVRRASDREWIEFVKPLLDERTFDAIGEYDPVAIGSLVARPNNRKDIGKITEINNNKATVVFDGGKTKIFDIKDLTPPPRKNPITRDDFLQEIHTALSSGVHLANTGDSLNVRQAAPTATSGGNLAKRISEDRVLHFKDADAAFEYNQRFGYQGLASTVFHGLEHMGQRTGLMRVWGTNPYDNLTRVRNEIVKRLKDSDERTAFDNAFKGRLSFEMAELDGSTKIPGNNVGAMWSSVIRSLQSMAHLGGAVLSAGADIGINAAALARQGGDVSLLKGQQQAIMSIIRPFTQKQRREFGATIGVISDGAIGAVAHRFDAADNPPGLVSKFMRKFFQLNLLTPWTDAVRQGHAMGTLRNLGFHKNTAWDSLDEPLQRTLTAYGLDAPVWDVLRQTEPHIHGDNVFMQVEGVRDLPDEIISAYLQRRGIPETDAAIARARGDIENRLRQFVVDRSDIAATMPDERGRALTNRGTQPGTVYGEVNRLFWQFKQFPVSVLMRSVGEIVYGQGADISTSGVRGFVRALGSGHGEMRGFASFIAMSAAYGYLSMSAKDLVKGRLPRDPTNPGTWSAALLQGGGLGIYGDFIFGELQSRYGQSPLETFMGPTFGTVTHLLDAFGTLKAGEPWDAGDRFMRTVMNHLPGSNLFYTRAALDYLILNSLQEYMSPGYNRRIERLIKRENDQEFWLPPSESLGV